MTGTRRRGGPVLTLVVGVLVILAAALAWIVWTGRYPDPAAMDVELELPTPPTLPSPMPDPQPAPLPIPGPKPG